MANIDHQTKTRLDVWLMTAYPDFSRAFLQKLCSQDKVLVDGVPQKSGYKLKGGELIEPQHDMASIIGLIPEINLPVLYEDDNVIVINKPAGVLSHGLSKFLGEPSVASFLRQRLNTDHQGDWKPEDLRFGIVHRLDRVTSGVMICAKNQSTMRSLQKQFHDRKVEKVYQALVQGRLKHSQALLDLPLERNPKAPATFRVGPNGKTAQTEYKVLKEVELDGRTVSHVELYPKTGRTHQLRVHMMHIGHSIIGDKLYKGSDADRLYLHASRLVLAIPAKGQQNFTAPLPAEFKNMLNKSQND